MSQFSIFESGWVELVFEHKNKNYGAYQLRKETTKNTVTAFFFAVLLIVSIISIFVLINKLSPKITAPQTTIETIIKPIDLDIVIPVTPTKPIPKTTSSKTNKTINHITNTPEFTQPEVVPEALATTEKFPDSNNFQSTTTSSNYDGVVTNSDSKNQNATNTTTENNAIVTTIALDAAPEFPGGIQKFYQYVGNHFSKPEIDEMVTFKVMVAFVIEKDGTMTDLKILKDPGYGLGQEAIRVLKSIKTKWTPGILNGKPMRTAYTLPIIIKTE